MQRIHHILGHLSPKRRIPFTIISVICTAVMLFTSTGAYAQLTAQQRTDYAALGIDFLDSPCDVASSVNTGNANQKGGIWNSGLQPPYILEQFMIQLLEDIAQKRGVPAADAVTPEHVVALITFAYGEGGGITNTDWWNPFNTGLNAPDLLATGNSTSGVQAFKSFDAGVEANARVMTMPYQSRLSDILIQPKSTAQQFFYTLTYYNKYSGNLEWAEASLPPHDASYYNNYLQLLQQTRDNYSSQASLQMRGSTSDPKDAHIPSLLQFSKSGVGGTGGGGNTGGSSSAADSCTGGLPGGGSQAIVAEAKILSWPEPFVDAPKSEQPVTDPNSPNNGVNRTGPLIPTKTYQAALKQFNPGGLGSFQGADCGAFVSTVMHTSGVDPKYPSLGTSTQLAYAEKATDSRGNKLYQVTPDVQDPSQLQAGDILVTDEHTWIFIGGQKFTSASASEGERMPNLDYSVMTDTNHHLYSRVRYIGSSSTQQST